MTTAVDREPRRWSRRLARRRAVRAAVERWTAREPLRLHMLGLVTLTGVVGLGASVVLLALGVRHMWLRYPLAALLAYGTFLTCLWAWLRHHREHWLDADRSRRSLIDPLDLVPTPDVPDLSHRSAASEPFTFGGGDFGGGGAGGHFDAVIETTSAPPSGSGGWWSHLDLGLDDAWPLLVAILIAASVVVAGVYLVWIAPALLGEVLIDGVVAGVAYRRLRRIAPERWLAGAWRRTWIPATCLVVSLACCGACAERLRPDADSIGDLVRSRTPTMQSR